METTAKYKPNVEVVSDPEGLAQRIAALFVSNAEKAIKTKGVFHVAISGGHTPKRFFELLSEEPKAKALPWDRIQLFWVDERYVPPDSPGRPFGVERVRDAVERYLKRAVVGDFQNGQARRQGGVAAQAAGDIPGTFAAAGG